jgi:hypothetical protein
MKWITRERPKIDRIACPWLPIPYIACKQATSQTQNNASSSGIKNNVIACAPGSRLDVAKIEQIKGLKVALDQTGKEKPAMKM